MDLRCYFTGQDELSMLGQKSNYLLFQARLL